jgi:hypothetical protein
MPREDDNGPSVDHRPVYRDYRHTISVPGLERAARFFTWCVAEAAKAPRGEINPPRP